MTLFCRIYGSSCPVNQWPNTRKKEAAFILQTKKFASLQDKTKGKIQSDMSHTVANLSKSTFTKEERVFYMNGPPLE